MSPQGNVSFGRIRILFNTPNPKLNGGPPTHLPILEKALAALVDVYAYEYGRRSETETLAQKVIERVCDLVRLRTACRKVRPDLVHHNSAFDPVAILRDAPLVLLAKRQRIPVFLKLHGSVPEAFRRGSRILIYARDFVLRNVDRIGVLSPIERDEFEQTFPYLRGKVCVVKNIINPEFAAVERKEDDRPTILFLSRFIREKGPFDLLRAAPLVLRGEPAAQFLFVGDGEDAATFDREAAAMKLGDSVRRLPRVGNHESLAFYAKAWMLVFPTHFPEGMPTVIGEAMAAGLPIISTPTRFSRSYMTEGTHVLYSQPGDVEGIASNVLRLCRNNELRAMMSIANRALALGFFAKDCVVKEYVDIYKRCQKLSPGSTTGGSDLQGSGSA